jgi:hypothetical protein
MKVKLLLVFSLVVYQFSFSQTEKLLKGVVSSENFLLKNVDVINKTSKISTTTDEKGEFIIQAKANDSLYFYAKEFYLKKIKLTSDQMDQNNLVVLMFKIPEELEEVVIRTVATSGISWEGDKKYKQDKRDELAVEKVGNRIKTGIYDGAIENSPDFGRIGGMILGLFRKEKEKPKEKVPDIEFATLAKNTCDEKFYIETLKLKPDEIDLFLQFCDADPKSKIVVSSSNELSMMDFLMVKNAEFKKLSTLK